MPDYYRKKKDHTESDRKATQTEIRRRGAVAVTVNCQGRCRLRSVDQVRQCTGPPALVGSLQNFTAQRLARLLDRADVRLLEVFRHHQVEVGLSGVRRPLFVLVERSAEQRNRPVSEARFGAVSAKRKWFPRRLANLAEFSRVKELDTENVIAVSPSDGHSEVFGTMSSSLASTAPSESVVIGDSARMMSPGEGTAGRRRLRQTIGNLNAPGSV